MIKIVSIHCLHVFMKTAENENKTVQNLFYTGFLVITRFRRKIVGAPHQSAPAPHRYVFRCEREPWIVLQGHYK
jgi:hypothetical protein